MLFNTVYLGTSSIAIEILYKHENFKLQNVICEKKRITPNYLKIANDCKINVTTFESKEDLYDKLEQMLNKVDIFIIYQFDYILPLLFSSTNKFFNFHSGSLLTNRGAHPIIRTILNGESETELTLHQINEKIDQGLIIGTYKVQVLKTDDSVILKEKTEIGIPILLDKLNDFLNSKIKPKIVLGGIYYKPISEKDYTIDIKNDTESKMLNKIRSQNQYKGAIIFVNNNCFYVNSLVREYSKNSLNDVQIIGDYIKIQRGYEIIKLFINKNI